MRAPAFACTLTPLGRDVKPGAPIDGRARPAHERAMPDPDSPPSLASTLMALCAEAGAAGTVCPTDAAKTYADARGEAALGWRSHLQEVRREAVLLARDGKLVIYRKGKPVDPDDFRGVYRLGAPRDD